MASSVEQIVVESVEQVVVESVEQIVSEFIRWVLAINACIGCLVIDVERLRGLIDETSAFCERHGICCSHDGSGNILSSVHTPHLHKMIHFAVTSNATCYDACDFPGSEEKGYHIGGFLEKFVENLAGNEPTDVVAPVIQILGKVATPYQIQKVKAHAMESEMSDDIVALIAGLENPSVLCPE